METRNLNHEKRIKAYLFKGNVGRFKAICINLGITKNLKCLNENKKQIYYTI